MWPVSGASTVLCFCVSVRILFWFPICACTIVYLSGVIHWIKSHHVLMQCLWFERNVFKTQRKCRPNKQNKNPFWGFFFHNLKRASLSWKRNYVKGVHKNIAIMNAKNCTLFVFPLEKYKFVIPKWLNMGIVLNYGNLWFSCVNSPKSAVCHVSSINNENWLNRYNLI